MARAQYVITAADYHTARDYLQRKLRLNLYWIDDTQAYSAFELCRDAVTLSQWCERWLDPQQWRQLKAAVRATRQRQRRQSSRDGPNIHVSLTRPAGLILRELAKRDGVTLSEFIVRHHYQAWIDIDAAEVGVA